MYFLAVLWIRDKASIAGEQAAQVPTRSLADPDYVLSCSVGSGSEWFAPWIRIRISFPLGMRNRIQRQGHRPKLINKPDFQPFKTTFLPTLVCL
jgi:hypothetical protein